MFGITIGGGAGGVFPFDEEFAATAAVFRLIAKIPAKSADMTGENFGEIENMRMAWRSVSVMFADAF